MISEELKNEIVEWHKMQFPDATLEDVEDKLSEELKELCDAIKNLIEEVSDVSIVLTSLVRYEIASGDVIIEHVNEIESMIKVLADRLVIVLDNEVKNKMAINKKRDWSKRK